jgi:predicted CoA-binding protein
MKETTLVFGASLKPERYSNVAVRRLRENGHKVKAFGLREGVIADVSIDTELIPYEGIKTISLYLSPKHQKNYFEHLIGLKPDRIIFNPGTENWELIKLLDKHSIDHEIACTLVLLSTGQY